MKLIIIANRLPVKATKNEDNQFEFSRSEGGLTTGLEYDDGFGGRDDITYLFAYFRATLSLKVR